MTTATKLTDYVVSADRETEIEMYQGYETKTVIIEWDNETRIVRGFDEADCVYTGSSLDECRDALGLDADEFAGLIGSDVVYMDRRNARTYYYIEAIGPDGSLCDRDYAMGPHARVYFLDEAEAEGIASDLQDDVGDIVSDGITYQVESTTAPNANWQVASR